MALVSTAWAAQGSATITKISGTAQMSTDGSTWSAAAVGKSLAPGSSIKSAAGGQVDLTLGSNGGAVQLTASTELKIEKLTSQSSGAGSVVETGLDLKSGTIVGRVNQLPAGSKYEIKTPSSVIAINATRGSVRYQINANGTAHVLEGQIAVSRATGAAQTVNSGQTFNGAGAASGTVTATNPADLVALPPPLMPGGGSPPTLPTAPTVQFVSPVPEVSGTTGN